MARSLDELIQFLLDEIALSGQLGSTPADVLSFVNQFYKDTGEHAAIAEDNPGRSWEFDCPTIDRAFLEQVWRWLVKHPDVYIGGDKRGNKQTRSAVQAQYLNGPLVVTPGAAKDTWTSLEPNLSEQRFESLKAKDMDAPRVCATEQRIWLAICGHPRDLNKLFETEFVLLSIIASHREPGILQGELVKESGQDKRSVPKRTDELRNKGYIEKRVVYIKGFKTSRLILKKFASSFNDLTTSKPVSVDTQGTLRQESIDFHVLIRKLFSILKERQIVTRCDLKKELQMVTTWRARVLARVIRKLEAIGCLKRVRAASESSKKVGYFFYCVKIVHEPSESDLDMFFSSGPSITNDHAVEGSDPEDEAETGQRMGGKTPLTETNANQLEEVGRIVPQWNPDRPLANALLHVVHEAGMQGVTNKELRQQLMGDFIRRPVEHILTRLTTLWHQSQPSHLWHLAIVRDTVLLGTLPLYVQYSLENFEARVRSGQAYWEAVKPPDANCAEKSNKTLSDKTPVSSSSPELDEFGFPAKYNPSSQHMGGRTTLGLGLLAARPDDLPLSNRDSRLYGDVFGSSIAGLNAGETSQTLAKPVLQKAPSTGSQVASPHSSSTAKKPTQPLRAGPKSRGRPRKFLQGTEKFWQGQFAMAKRLAGETNHEALGSQAGLMSDPAGMSLFVRRPPLFDATLLRALQNGLPIPAEPRDITQEWVDRMVPILNRSSSGLYITPKGARRNGLHRHQFISQVLILRSHRLRELMLSKREFPAVRFFVSSAAHTFSNLRNDLLGDTVVESEDDNPDSPISHVPAQSRATDLESVPTQREDAPISPVIHPPLQVDSHRSPEVQGDMITTPRKRQRGRPKKSDRIDSQKGPLSKLAPHTHTMKRQAASTRLLPLTSPTTTRSSSPKRYSPTSATSPVAEAHNTPAELTLDMRTDIIGTFCDGSVARAQTEIPPPIVMLPTLADSTENKDNQKSQTKKQVKKQSKLVAEPNRAGQCDITEESDNRDKVNRIPGQAHDGFQSLLPSGDLRTMGSPQAATGATAGSEKPSVSKVDYHRLIALNDDERHSEAFRLVQELTANEKPQSYLGCGSVLPGAHNGGQSEQDSPGTSGVNTMAELRISDVDTNQEPFRKRNKQDGMAVGSVAVLRRKIMLELMEACGGALPYYPIPLWRAFTTAWRRSGQLGTPDMKTIKAVVKSLCQTGSAKQVKFSFRNKKGLATSKTILAKPNISISEHIILELQRKMIEKDPHPYLAGAMQSDSGSKKDMEGPKPMPWSVVLDEETVHPSVTPAKVLRLQLRETLSRAREEQHRTGPEAQQSQCAHDIPRGNVVPRARVRGIQRKYAKGSEPYQKPKLSMYNLPQSSEQRFSNQSTETRSGLNLRTEISPAPPTVHAVAPRKRCTPHPPASDSLRTKGQGSDTSRLGTGRTAPQVKPSQLIPVAWKKSRDQPALPSSLEDILRDDGRRSKPDYTRQNDHTYREFESDVDGVALWEQRSFNLFDLKSTNWIFINHLSGNDFQANPESNQSVTFGGLVWFDESGRENVETRFYATEQNEPSFMARGGYSTSRAKSRRTDTQGRPPLVAMQASRKRKRVSANSEEYISKIRRGNTKPQIIMDAGGQGIDVSHLIGAKHKRPRGTQHLRTMPSQMIYKLIVTVVVVRTLAGGLERYVDWPLVLCVFPDEDEQFLQDRWRTLANKHRRDIQQLSQGFQDRFPEAYAKGEVSQINFDDLNGVDWVGVVDWALNNLDKPLMRHMPELPANRSEFEANVHMDVEAAHRPYRELFAYNQPVTVPMKEVAISAIPFAAPLRPSPSTGHMHEPAHLFEPTDNIESPALTLARSWALSTITTPLDTFDPTKAHSKLQTLAPTAGESEDLIESTMRLLGTTKAVARKRDKGVDAKGRSFDLSRVFTDSLDQRRNINATLLKQAVHYKTNVLDPAFQRKETVVFQPVSVEDGDMIAILNLAANGRIEIRIGDDVPRNRWGIDQEARYQTRNIRKEGLYFTVLIAPNPEKYIFGNPLSSCEVPVPDLGTGPRDLIPIWRDIAGGFQRRFWELAIAAVLGILATRPGASMTEVTRMMSPSLSVWEMESLLGWCLEMGAVKKTGENDGAWSGGWEVKEWWWMILEYGRLEDVAEPG